ncbi:MAG: ribonuclease Z [Eubacteriales bacterium]|nr:ribonuclease Z [Eubacteriales bacterium]
MTAIICLDDNNGLLFNERRQSRDRAVAEDILGTCEGNIWMDTYSAGLFPKEEERICCADDFLDRVREGCCFVEKQLPRTERIDKLLVYRWNRIYPADVFFEMEGWKLESSREFQGNSHEKITVESYTRENR